MSVKRADWRSRRSGRSGCGSAENANWRSGRLLAGALGSGNMENWATGRIANSGGMSTGDAADFEGGAIGDVADSEVEPLGIQEVENWLPWESWNQANLAKGIAQQEPKDQGLYDFGQTGTGWLQLRNRGLAQLRNRGLAQDCCGSPAGCYSSVGSRGCFSSVGARGCLGWCMS